MKNNNKWYNDGMLLTQLIIIPPIFFYGLYYTDAVPTHQKKIITVSFLISLILIITYFTSQ